MILNLNGTYTILGAWRSFCTPSPGSRARFLYVCCIYAGADAVAGVERRRKDSSPQ